MRTSAVGSSQHRAGFTLLELLLVVAIVAMASVGVGFALRDGAQASLEREAARLAALFESARAQSRANGVPVRWRVLDQGFRFEGALPGTLPDHWMSADVLVPARSVVVLGPDPIIAPQSLVLRSAAQPQLALRIATDGVRPFSVLPVP